jgi:hypothetical protein
MEEWGHQAASRAQQKYKVSATPMKDVTPSDEYAGPAAPLPGKASTMGSLASRTAWKSPSGPGYSSQTSKSTLFDEPTSTAQVPREQ